MRCDPRGALWYRWDLQVHTPASLVHQYPGHDDAVWDQFLNDLEALPANVRVLGINDYLFIDGYERLLEERDRGRLSNLDLILPVIELRLDTFGGSDSGLSRANFHVIFSDNVSPTVIREQFISGLTSSFQLLPRHAGTAISNAWSGILSPTALDDLGCAIIDSVPEAERRKYAAPRIEGFNNLTVSLEKVKERLESSFLRDDTLTAVGLTEWSDIKWKDGSIADKKNVINSADFVFVSAESPAAYGRARKRLIDGEVNAHLVDCSDAHYLSSSNEKDRIGNCFTWIKADRSFGGLLQARQEFENRIFVGEEPPELTRLREHPSRYVRSVTIRKDAEVDASAVWFDVELSLNCGLVAIIGNKGSGKSALAEIIGVTAASGREEHFSFLTDTKFCDPRQNLASEFVATTTWLDRDEVERRLDEGPLERDPLVQHLPQRYLEKLCTEVPSGEKTEFDRELERIIFSHLPVEQRLGATSLPELITLIERPLETKAAEIRRKLQRINRDVAVREALLSAEEKRTRQQLYRSARREWWELKKRPPPRIDPPSAEDSTRAFQRERLGEFSVARGHIKDLNAALRKHLAAVRKDRSDLEAFRSALEALAERHALVMEEHQDFLVRLGLGAAISTIHIDHDSLDDMRTRLSEREAELTALLHDDRSPAAALSWIDDEVRVLQEQLSGPAERYERYLTAVNEWKERVQKLRGGPDDPTSAVGARAALDELRAVPGQLATLQEERRDLARQLHEVLLGQANEHANLYVALESFMQGQPIPPEYTMSVETALVDTSFAETFLETMVNRHATGSFCGVVESEKMISAKLSKVDFNDPDDVVEFVDQTVAMLHADFRQEERPATDIVTQLRKDVQSQDVYDYVYAMTYLSPRFSLQFGGKPVYRLSPGEKGTLLLIFFLLADQDQKPLIVDQPEDNLDNQTVYRALVRCFQEARQHRQVLLVTHNPNLAVVCDADQVVVASMSGAEGPEITYDSGAIETPRIVRAIVDILEGTQIAFENRSIKYTLHQYGHRVDGEGRVL